MKKIKHINVVVLILFISLSAFTSLHKYYVSVTEINYAKEEASLQIISRLFINDFEAVLQERYDKNFRLDDEKTAQKRIEYVQKYYDKRLSITVNGVTQKLNLLGTKFEDDMMVSYLEIPKLKNITTLTVTNKLLFNTGYNQQNITHIAVNNKKKSFLFIEGNDTQTLNFKE